MGAFVNRVMTPRTGALFRAAWTLFPDGQYHGSTTNRFPVRCLPEASIGPPSFLRHPFSRRIQWPQLSHDCSSCSFSPRVFLWAWFGDTSIHVDRKNQPRTSDPTSAENRPRQCGAIALYPFNSSNPATVPAIGRETATLAGSPLCSPRMS